MTFHAGEMDSATPQDDLGAALIRLMRTLDRSMRQDQDQRGREALRGGPEGATPIEQQFRAEAASDMRRLGLDIEVREHPDRIFAPQIIIGDPETFGRALGQIADDHARAMLVEARVWHHARLAPAWARASQFLQTPDSVETMMTSERNGGNRQIIADIWAPAVEAVGMAVHENPRSRLTRRLVDGVAAHLEAAQSASIPDPTLSFDTAAASAPILKVVQETIASAHVEMGKGREQA